MRNDRRRVAIIGAGIGGLAAALACQKAGIEFALFDHAEDPLAGGAALTLWANALIGLNQLGVLDKGTDWLHPIRKGNLRTDQNVNLYELPLDWMQATYGYRPTCVTRSQLTQKLYDALGRPHIRKAQCERINQANKQVTVYFSDRSSETFDGVIAADGIHSAVRYQLIGDSKRTANYTAWRGMAIDARVPPASMGEYLGRGLRFGYATINSSTTYWFATVNNRLLPANSSVEWSHIVEEFSGFPKPIQSCIEGTPVGTVIQTSIQEVRPGAPMAWRNAAILGDAAHAITPNLGLGACLAIEDANVLFHNLRSGISFEQAFALYAKNRRNRVAKIARFTRWLGKAMQMEQQSLSFVRNSTIRVMPTIITNSVWKTVLG